MNIKILTEAEIKDLFEVFDVADLQDLLPPEKAAQDDVPNFGRVAQPENFGLDTIGQGDYAIIAAHPYDEDQVIRVSRPDDGWIGYAATGTPNPLRPVVHALGWTGQVWVAITEALTPLPPRLERKTQHRIREMFLWSGTEADVDAAQRIFDETHAQGLSLDDLEARNLMLRANGDLVLNDPVSFMPDALEAALKVQFKMREQACVADISM